MIMGTTVNIVLKFVMIAVISSLPLGCVYRNFPANQLPQIENLQPPKDGEMRYHATYWISVQFRDTFSTEDHLPGYRSVVEKQFDKTLKASGYFLSLSPFESLERQKDMTIEVHWIDDINSLAMSMNFVSGLMLSIIPSWSTLKTSILVNVKTIYGKEKTYQLEDSMTRVIWLPMVLMPNRISEDDFNMNMWKNLILRMQQDGLFEHNK
jgi:hypothetical protein